LYAQDLTFIEQLNAILNLTALKEKDSSGNASLVVLAIQATKL